MYVIFIYRQDGLNDETRQKIVTGVYRKVIGNCRPPISWNNFIRCNENKTEIFGFLIDKEGRALTGFPGPPKSQNIKVSVRHFILYVLIDEMSKCFNLILISLLWLLWLHKMAANMG